MPPASADRPRICLLFAGGTISMARDPQTDALRPASAAEDILHHVPELETVAEIETVSVTAVDSTNILPVQWREIASEIRSRMERCDGFVVTHGTDTMAYTASALSFMLQNLPKPVVLTGAQMPLCEAVGSDARNNLVHSFRFAAADIAEVSIFCLTELFRGNRTIKFSLTDFDAFKSFNHPPLGSVGVELKIHPSSNRRMPRRMKLFSELEENVCLLKYFPGMKPGVLLKAADDGCRGFVIEGVGPGNLPTVEDFPAAIKELRRREIPVVVVSQCPKGPAEMQLYEVGLRAEEAGAICGKDMTSEAALAKLMWALPQAASFDELAHMLGSNIAGELTS